MNYRMIALDLDGTLTNSEKKISPKTKETLQKALEQGVTVVLASGRPTCGVTPLAKELNLAEYGGYILSFNGGCILDCKTGKPFSQQVLPMDVIPSLVEFAKREQVSLITYEGDEIITETPDCYYTGLEAKINHIGIRQIDDFASYVQFPVTKCLMLDHGDRLAEVEKLAAKAFGDRLNIYRSEPHFLEIMPQHIDKAYSLGKLLEHLGMTREQLIACGDGFNDASMIEFAGLGVVMANGQPQVKALADVVTGSNDEDGLVPIIEQYLLK